MRLLIGLLAGILLPAGSIFASSHSEPALQLQVLGSGGPVADDARASSGYLIWLNGQSTIMVDAGGGSFLRFGEAGARIEDLKLIALTHFHTDHSADLPALLKSGYFADRRQPMSIAGPSGNARFPGLQGFLSAMLDPESGAYRYLSGYLDGQNTGLFRLVPIEVDTRDPAAQLVMRTGQLAIDALAVPHGPVPSLAYRIAANGKTIVVSGDQNLSAPGFQAFLQDADLWVMPLPIPEDAGGAARNLHAVPSLIGKTAAAAGVRCLVLSHFMARSLATLDQQIAVVRQHFDGHLILAEDLQKIPLD